MLYYFCRYVYFRFTQLVWSYYVGTARELLRKAIVSPVEGKV
jgi:hypothetical protein